MRILSTTVFLFLFSHTFANAGEVAGHLAALAVRGNVPSGIYSGTCRDDFSQPLNIPCEVTVEAFGDSYNANFVNKTTGEQIGTFWFQFDQGGYMHHDHWAIYNQFTFLEDPYVPGIVLSFSMDESANPPRPVGFFYNDLAAGWKCLEIELDPISPAPISVGKGVPVNTGNYLYKMANGSNRKRKTK